MGGHFHIAIADDDGVCREFLACVLRRMGHDVVCQAENGRQLVQYCLESPPDLVITDVRMPELDGIAAAAEITCKYNVPIVLLSASDLPPNIEKLHDAQLVVRRIKPVSRVDVEKVLAEVAAKTAVAAAA